MAISSTTFEERLARINNGQTVDQASILANPTTPRYFPPRRLTFPFMVGVGILTGGTANAFATSPADMQWVMALAG